MWLFCRDCHNMRELKRYPSSFWNKMSSNLDGNANLLKRQLRLTTILPSVLTYLSQLLCFFLQVFFMVWKRSSAFPGATAVTKSTVPAWTEKPAEGYLKSGEGNLVGRTPCTLSRSSVCLAPTACRGCRCLHTWEPSEESSDRRKKKKQYTHN